MWSYGIDIIGTAEYYDHFKLKPKSFLEIWRALEGHYPSFRFKFYEQYTLPFDTGFFDAVIYYAALEHMPKDLAIISLKEAHRVLKKYGKTLYFLLSE